MGLPNFQLCKFDLTSILVMAPIALATMMEHIGDMSAISATTERNFLQDPGLQRTLLGRRPGHLPWRASSAAQPTPPTARIPACWSCPRSMTPW